MAVGTLLDVRETIIKLWRERTDTPIDLLESLRGTEVAARNDYSGRVIFEYFQNAIDRAEKSIEIALEIDGSGESARLIIANDGEPVTISSGAELPGQAPKSDFHSLCAIFRSDKKPGESIGNKGVGFKSGWEFARRATIASTLISSMGGQDKVRWAFRLHQSLDVSALESGEFWQELAGGPETDRKLHEEVAQRLDLLGKAPSFLFPEFITDPQIHFDGFDWATTVIVLDGIVGKDKISRLESLIGDFGSARLFFVQQLRNWSPQDITVKSSIRRDGTLLKEFEQSTKPPENWTVIKAGEDTLPGWLARRDELAAEAGNLNFEIKEPSLAIAFPPIHGEEKDAGENSLFFCYLPTQVPVPLQGRVHIHGDFLLDIARKNVLDNAYNRGLLKEAARLLVRTVAGKSSLHDRDDAASFLSRGSNGQTPAFTEEMEHLLFSEDCEGQDSPWSVTYLKNAFVQEHCSEARHSHALQFVQSWCYQVYREWESTTKHRRTKRLRLLAKHALPLIPLSVEQGLVRERAEVCEEDSFNLFLRKRDKLGDAPLKDLDVFASDAFSGFGISTWADLEKFNVFGVREFKFDQVIAAVRRAVSLRFAEKLEPKTESELGFSPGKLLNLIVALRFDEQNDTTARAGGALLFLGKKGTAPTVYQDLAWLPLPVEGEKWLPAFRVLLKSGLPDAEKALELRGTILSQGFRMLDDERLAALPALSSIPDAGQAIAIEIGAWPCLPLDLKRPDGEIKLVFPIDMARDDYRIAREIFRAVVGAWPMWSAVQLNNRERLAGILKELCGEVPWFPLPVLNRCVPVPDVVLTKGAPIKAEFVYEFRGEGEAENLLLCELGIRLPEESAPDRLVRLVKRMGEFSPNADQLRGRYRTLMESLSKHGFIAKESLPLLVSRDRRLVWRKLSEDRPVGFAGRRHLTWRN